MNLEHNAVFILKGTKFLPIVVFLLLNNGVYTYAGAVNFFRDTEYKDFLLQINDTVDCTNLPDYANNLVRAIRTNGCTVFYKYPNCHTNPSGTNEYQVLTIRTSEAYKLADYSLLGTIRSFRRCTNQPGGTHLSYYYLDVNSVNYNRNMYHYHNECSPFSKLAGRTPGPKVRTSGCLMVYSSYSCNTAGIKVLPTGSSTKDLSTYFSSIGSVQQCTDSGRTGVVKFYKNDIKAVPLHTASAYDTCSQFPTSLFSQIRNALSTHCVMLYNADNCEIKVNAHFSLKLEPGTPSNLDLIYNQLRSFRLCNSTEGTDKARITFKDYRGPLSSYIAKEVCGCQDLPSSFSPLSLTNEGTCVDIFLDRGCKKWGRTVPGGETGISKYIKKLTYTNIYNYFGEFFSFKLCQPFSTCYNLTATATKFQIKSDFSQEFLEKTVQNVELAAKATFFNNGTGTLSKEYMANRRISESISVERVKSVSVDHSVGVEISATTEMGGGFLGLPSISLSLTTSYNYQTSSSETEGKTEETTVEKEFGITQTVEVPACTKYEVSSFVKVAHLPMDYDVFANVRGTTGSEKMTAKLLKEHLPSDLVFYKDLDEFTVVAKGRGKIIATFGIDSVLSADGAPIEGCLKD